VKVLPLTRGEIARYQKRGGFESIMTDEKDDLGAEILSTHVTEPALSKEEYLGEDFKVGVYVAMFEALLKVSGINSKKK
jgi:hypothetical protein